MINKFQLRLFFSFFTITLLMGCFDCKDFLSEPIEYDISSATIDIISGNNQYGTGGIELNNELVIQITDREGNPAQDIEVSLTIVEGGGTFTSQMPIITDLNGMAQVGWKIGESHNATKVTLCRNDTNVKPIFFYATGDNPRGMANTKSLNSLTKVGNNFYSMSFYGDYSNVVNDVNNYFVGDNFLKPVIRYNCSLFSIFGNPTEYLFGRSFDNPVGWQCLTLIGEYNPPNGYKSYAFSRMQDYGYQFGTDIEDLDTNDKMRLFESAGHVPDGINECGVVAGLANVRPLNYDPDTNKETIWVTVLVRKILDNASNIEEAIAIANAYNISCPDNNTLGIHVLVADATGRSVILEMGDGYLQANPNTKQWQVITNFPSYNVSIETQQLACTRFNYIYDYLHNKNGNISISQGMSVLENVGWPNATEWSAMYNLTEKSVRVAIDFNFNNLYNFQIN